MKKEYLYIIGALAAVLGLYFITTRRDAIVQLPQTGRVGTAPGVDTTGIELGFKSNIFSTYADYLKNIAAGEQATQRVKEQSALEQARIRAGVETGSQRETGLLERQRLTESGQSERARIFAEADVATSGQRSSAELARIAAQDAASRRAATTQRTGGALDALAKALGQLFGGGSGAGGGAPTSRNPRGARTPIPRPNVRPFLFDPNYEPSFPSFDAFGGFGDDFFNPFSDVFDPFFDSPRDIFSEFPTFGDPGNPYAGFGDPFYFYDAPVGGFPDYYDGGFGGGGSGNGGGSFNDDYGFADFAA